MRAHIRTVIVLALAAGLVLLFVRNVDLRVVVSEILRARLPWLATSLAMTFISLVIRSFRWQYLLEPLGRASFGNAFRATAVGFAASSILPARAGEVIRPYFLARHENMTATGAFATIILERVLDVLTVVALLGAFIFFFDEGVGLSNPTTFAAVKWAGVTALAGLIARVAEKFVRGLGAVRRPGRLLVALMWSFPLWLSIAGGLWSVAMAFRLQIPFTGTFLMIALLVIGVAVPTPGAIGGFHEAFRLGATLF